jgi:hypothetical protein
MKINTSVKLVRVLSWITALVIVAVPFHAFLTVWLASSLGHYTALRLWKEFLLAAIVVGSLWLLWRDRAVRRKMLSLWLVRLIFIYFGLLLVCGVVGLIADTVTTKAMLYGLLVDSRFLVFFLAVMILAAKYQVLSRNWQKLIFIPAIIVAAFAILQYLFLPFDFLKHFGYGESTIFPYETINHNLNHLRVASTLRGANPLGAYLLLPLTAASALFVRQPRQRTNLAMISAGLALALVFSFSRSAWLGAVVSLILILLLAWRWPFGRRASAIGVSLLFIVLVVTAIGLRNNLSFENFVFHTDRQSKIATSSNEGHAVALKSAVRDIVHQPQGRGVGSAGPQSVYNRGQARIAEDYYLQIGQEAGILGLLLLGGICVSLGKILYERRDDSLALVLFASLIGLSLVNLLSHAWSDDTLAYVWWGLAGIYLGPAILTVKAKQSNAKKIKKQA